MGNIGLELSLIFLLLVASGLFSMAEMAVVSSRKARLKQRAEEGSRGAKVALELANSPNDFLSTVQVGITTIGLLTGTFGGATIAKKLQVYLEQFPQIAAYAQPISMSTVVAILSYVSLILGELVPKNLALTNAEAIASAVAPPMLWIAKMGSPAVRFLTLSTNIVMKLLPVKASADAPVTAEEIKVLVAQGTEHGTFEEAEREMVEGVFRLGNRRVVELMQPRGKVAWLDVNNPWAVNRETIKGNPHSRYPVVEGDLDRSIGFVHVKDLFSSLDFGESPDLRALARKPIVVPEAMAALDLLERFQQSGEQMALIVDEHGGIEGLATLTDLMNAVVGDLHASGGETGDAARPRVLLREDGSWLVDGSLPISDLMEQLQLRDFPGEEQGFATVGGLVLAHLRRIPVPGDHFTVAGWRFEVIDMDRNRIDKVLVARSTTDERSNYTVRD
jgi:putative hemolysin